VPSNIRISASTNRGYSRDMRVNVFGRARQPLVARGVTSLLVASAMAIAFSVPAVAAPHARLVSATAEIKISDFATQAQVIHAVEAAQSLTTPPPGVQPPLTALENNSDFGMSGAWATCPGPGAFQYKEDLARCTFGDVHAANTIVLTGDSRAQMWFDSLNAIASATHFKLVLLAKSGCPSPAGNYPLNNGGHLSAAPWPACKAWDKWVTGTIQSMRPALVIFACDDILQSVTLSGALPTPAISNAFVSLFKSVPKGARFAMIGGFPDGGQANPTLCLSKSPNDVHKCAYDESAYLRSLDDVVQKDTIEAGGTYVNETPWLCAKVCPALIARTIPYTIDSYHIDGTYCHYLTGVLWAALAPDLRA
jgi:hypothetical protein